MTMSMADGKKPGSFPGWIFVLLFLLLCGISTGLTWWNYSRQVVSSTGGSVLESQWPETRIAVLFPKERASAMKPGHVARVTVGKDTRALRGEVVSVTPGPQGESVVIRLTDEPPAVPGTPEGWNPHWLPPGTPCSVTIDTTIPPGVLAPAKPTPLR
jgi:hypothetical protein